MQALRDHGEPQPGQRAPVGAVGTFAVLIEKSLGATGGTRPSRRIRRVLDPNGSSS